MKTLLPLTDLEMQLQNDVEGLWLRTVQAKLFEAARTQGQRPRMVQLALEAAPRLLEQLWRKKHPQIQLSPLNTEPLPTCPSTHSPC